LAKISLQTANGDDPGQNSRQQRRIARDLLAPLSPNREPESGFARAERIGFRVRNQIGAIAKLLRW